MLWQEVAKLHEVLYFIPALPGEEWRLITEKSAPGEKPYYSISSFGRVYSSAIRDIMTPSNKNSKGYYRIHLFTEDGQSKYFSVHRLVLTEFCYRPDCDSLQVNHIDGNKANNCLTNLEWCTGCENIQHAYRTGLITARRGEDNSCASITNDQADMIGQLLKEGKYIHKEIADIVGCKKSIVDHISNGQSWRFVYDKYDLGNAPIAYRWMSDEDLHRLCKYFEDHHLEYSTKTDLFKAALMDLFGIIYNHDMATTLLSVYNHKARRNVTDLYNF